MSNEWLKRRGKAGHQQDDKCESSFTWLQTARAGRAKAALLLLMACALPAQALVRFDNFRGVHTVPAPSYSRPMQTILAKFYRI